MSWYPTSYEAETVLEEAGIDGGLALRNLYREAHETDYAPRKWTEEELSEAWRVDRRKVVRILTLLEEAGLLSLTRAVKGSKLKSTLTVVSPLSETLHKRLHKTLHKKEEDTIASFIERAQEPAQDIAQARARSFSHKVDPVVYIPAQPESNPAPIVGPGVRPQEGQDRGGLITSPDALRKAVCDPHADRIATLLEHVQRGRSLFSFTPADLMAIRPALKRWDVSDLCLVWDWAQLSPQMEYARRSSWAHSWATLANDRLPDRIRDSQMWHEAGRPLEVATRKATARRTHTTMDDALSFPSSGSVSSRRTEDGLEDGLTPLERLVASGDPEEFDRYYAPGGKG